LVLLLTKWDGMRFESSPSPFLCISLLMGMEYTQFDGILACYQFIKQKLAPIRLYLISISQINKVHKYDILSHLYCYIFTNQ
jgi:hypothetical protein